MTTSMSSSLNALKLALFFALGIWACSSGLISAVSGYWSDIAYLAVQHMETSALFVRTSSRHWDFQQGYC